MKRAVLLTLLLSSLSALLAGCGHHLDLSKEPNQLNFGVQAAKMNLWREALFRARRAVEIAPEDAMARNNLAVAYEGIGDFEKARAAYLEALKLDRTNSYIQKNYSRFTEFTAKNKKRERPVSTSSTPSDPKNTPPATNTPVPNQPGDGDRIPPPAPAPPAVPGAPEPQPTPATPPHGGAR